MLKVVETHGIDQSMVVDLATKANSDYHRSIDRIVCDALSVDDLDSLNGKKVSELLKKLNS
jgi:hypothetical protein